MFWVGLIYFHSFLFKFHRSYLVFDWSCSFCVFVYFIKRNCLQISPNNTLDLKSFNIISGHIPTLEHIFFCISLQSYYVFLPQTFSISPKSTSQFQSNLNWTLSFIFLQITTSFFTNICSKNIQQSSQCCPLLSRNFRQIVQFRTPVILTLNHEEDSVGFIEMF